MRGYWMVWCVVCSVLWVSDAVAVADYDSWWVVGGIGGHYPTPEAGCEAYASANGFTFGSLTYKSTYSYNCKSASNDQLTTTTADFTGGCADADPAGTYEYTSGQGCTVVPVPVDCSNLPSRKFNGTGSPPPAWCFEGCLYRSAGVGVILGGGYTMGGVSESTPCVGGETQGTAAQSNCLTSAGNQFCISDTDQNCGFVNGQSVCVDSMPPDGDCSYIAGGSYICDDGVTTTPPAPNNGTAGVPAAPDVVIQGDTAITNNTSGTYNYFSEGTVAAADNSAGNAPQSTGIVSGESDTGPVEIDESGTPEVTGDEYDALFESTGMGDLLDTIADVPEVGTGFTTMPLIPGYSTCQSLHLVWNGYALDFPDASQCARLESVKSIIGWLLYVLTGWGLFNLVTRSGNK